MRRPERFLCGRVDRLLPTIYLVTTRQLNVFLKPCFLGLVGCVVVSQLNSATQWVIHLETRPLAFSEISQKPALKTKPPHEPLDNKNGPMSHQAKEQPKNKMAQRADKKQDGPKSRQKTRWPKEPATKTRDTKQNNDAKQKTTQLRTARSFSTPPSPPVWCTSGLAANFNLCFRIFVLFVSLAFQCTLARLQRLWKWWP